MLPVTHVGSVQHAVSTENHARSGSVQLRIGQTVQNKLKKRTSHVTRHTSPLTCHMSHVTHHTCSISIFFFRAAAINSWQLAPAPALTNTCPTSHISITFCSAKVDNHTQLEWQVHRVTWQYALIISPLRPWPSNTPTRKEEGSHSAAGTRMTKASWRA